MLFGFIEVNQISVERKLPGRSLLVVEPNKSQHNNEYGEDGNSNKATFFHQNSSINPIIDKWESEVNYSGLIVGKKSSCFCPDDGHKRLCETNI
jgi:hypothetical protein